MPRLVHFEMNVEDVHKTIAFYEEYLVGGFKNGMGRWIIGSL